MGNNKRGRGAPRKPEHEKKQTACIAIHEDIKAAAKEIGDGNISRGIHIAVKYYDGGPDRGEARPRH